MQRIVIFGATSGIAEASAREFAKAGASFYLVARNGVALDDLGADLNVRGAASVQMRVADLSEVENLSAICREAGIALGGIDVALIAHGVLPDQKACLASCRKGLGTLQVNAVSPAVLMLEIAGYLTQQGHGHLLVLSSVAGDRGRPSNYIYGASKALLSVLGEGMALDLASKGIKVLVVKPGFVDTKMTAAFKKGALWASASDVGEAIVEAVKSGKSGVLYTPRWWQLIMLIIKHAPGFIVRRI